jgi:hypothetical protein
MEDAVNQPEADYKINVSTSGEILDIEKTQEEPKQEETVEQEVEATEEVVTETEEVVEDKKEEAEESESPQPSREELFNQLLSDKYNMNSDELENVLNKKEEKRELPEEVEKYLEYREKTNRGLNDYLALQQDFDEMPNQELLKEYYRQTKQGLDDSDIDALLDLKFGYDEGADDTIVKTKTLEMKEEVYKAKQHLNAQKDQYMSALESSASLSQETEEAVKFYQLYKEEQQKVSKQNEEVLKTFRSKTDKLFNDEFKGFEFKIGEEKVVFKPKDVEQTKKSQSDLSNFINQHMDENGTLKDAKAYHTALSMAMNPEAYAKFFYEQGKASAVNDVVAQGKNIDMNVRKNVDTSKPGPKFRVLDDGNFGSGLKINKR